MEILAIDPSVNNVGVAWHNTLSDKNNWEWTLIHPIKGINKEGMLLDIYYKIRKWMDEHALEVDMLVVEYPQFQQGAKGAVAATMGYTLDLAAIGAYLCGRFESRFRMYTPLQWKGNMPKSAIEFRWKKAFPGLPLPSDHEQEACMMIHHCIKEE